MRFFVVVLIIVCHLIADCKTESYNSVEYADGRIQNINQTRKLREYGSILTLSNAESLNRINPISGQLNFKLLQMLLRGKKDVPYTIAILKEPAKGFPAHTLAVFKPTNNSNIALVKPMDVNFTEDQFYEPEVDEDTHEGEVFLDSIDIDDAIRGNQLNNQEYYVINENEINESHFVETHNDDNFTGYPEYHHSTSENPYYLPPSTENPGYSYLPPSTPKPPPLYLPPSTTKPPLYLPPPTTKPPLYLPPPTTKPPLYLPPPTTKPSLYLPPSTEPSYSYLPPNTKHPEYYLPPSTTELPKLFLPPELYLPPSTTKPPALYLPPSTAKPPAIYLPPSTTPTPSYLPPSNEQPGYSYLPPSYFSPLGNDLVIYSSLANVNDTKSVRIKEPALFAHYYIGYKLWYAALVFAIYHVIMVTFFLLTLFAKHYSKFPAALQAATAAAYDIHRSLEYV